MEDPLFDDEALRALGRRARAQLDARPRAWEAVTRGEREQEEVAAERLAAADAPEAVALARELFRPPDEAEHAAMVDALLLAQANASPRPAVVAMPAETAANDAGRAWWMAVLALAAVVALAWWLVPGRSGSPVEPNPPLLAQRPLPAYEPGIENDGGLTGLRSDPGNPSPEPRYRVDTRFEWRVRPRSSAEGELDARAFAFQGSTAKSLATDGLLEVHASGAVRMTGTIEALGLTPGAWTIAIAVGRPSALPSDPSAVRDAQDTETCIVRRLRVLVED